MSNQSNRPIQSLEFDEIKENLKDYLRTQTVFKDYDFEGSALSVIMDLLAYNTHYQAYYANMVANESFLDSAVMRESIVSLAKHLNYVPRSIKASRLTVDAVLGSSTGDELDIFTQEVIQGKQFIDRGTIFRGKDIDGKSVSFVTLDSYKAVRRSGENIVKDIVLYQGSLKQISYIANTQDENIPKFVIPDKNVDIDTLVVAVQRSETDNSGRRQVWDRITDITKVDSTTTGFFIQENKEGLWEIYFGDGIIGRAIENGNVVFMRYLVTNGASGNGIGFDESPAKRSITCSDGRVREVRIQTDAQGKVLVSNNGRDPEDPESIRFYAPRNYQAQDRAVTSDDYRAILGKEYSNRADSFYIWGGEENDPPQYGKVFISIKPKVGNRLSLSEKQAIERTILGERNLVTIVPEVVDPDILYIIPNITLYYDESKTALSREGIESRMINIVKLFNTQYLGVFQKNFRSSKFSSAIDGSSPAINSNTTEISLMKEFEPNIGRPAPYTINFDNALLHPIEGYSSILSSTVFGYIDATSTAKVKPTVDAFLDDDGYGNIRIFKQVGSKKIIINKKIGSIDYVKGTISLRNFTPQYLGSGQTSIRLTVKPENKDIFSRRNQIITIDELSINITAVPEKTVIDRNASDSPLSR
jgi:hypothetical protein